MNDAACLVKGCKQRSLKGRYRYRCLQHECEFRMRLPCDFPRGRQSCSYCNEYVLDEHALAFPHVEK